MTNMISMLNGSVNVPFLYFEEKAHAGKGDLVVVSGTLVEGIGNSRSDIDCIVLCKRRPRISDVPIGSHVSISDGDYNPNATDAELHNTYDYLNESKIHVDFDYILFSEIGNLIDKINHCFEDLKQDQRIIYEPMMTAKEDRFIHRLKVAVPVIGKSQFEGLRERVPFYRFRYVSARELAANFYAFQDVQGTWESGDWQMAQDGARELLITQLRSFMQLAGLTNKHRKWIFACVTQLAGEDRRLGLMCAEHLLNLGRSKYEAQTFIRVAMRLMDDLFVRGVWHQQQTPDFPDPEACVAQLEKEFAKRGQTNHRLSKDEFEFRLKALRPAATRPLVEMLEC